jgi:Ala-tRNA(Pro) deacylase
VAKTVVVRTGEGFTLAVLPATSRVNLDRLAAALRVDRAGVRLATADEINRIFLDCEPGTIPPFGRLYGLRTAVDESLLEAETVVLRTNARHQGLRMAFRDYEGMEEPIRALFGEPISPRTVEPGPTVPRHAGSLRNAKQR